jgi:predicted nucleic acid-binding protein
VKKIILDTNAYTRFLAGDQDVLDILGASETVYMSIFVLGELYAGFFLPSSINTLMMSRVLPKSIFITAIM